MNRDLAEVVTLTKDMYHYVDKAIEAELSKGLENPESKVLCRKECAGCCHQQVLAKDPEVYAIVDWILKQDKNFIRKILKKLRAFDKRTKDIYEKYPSLQGDKAISAAEEYFKRRIPCPFLKNSICTIYPVRPMECRKLFVVGKPGEVCKYLEPDNHETVQIVDMRLANKVQGIAERQIFTPDDKIFVIVFQLQVLDVLEQVLGTKR